MNRPNAWALIAFVRRPFLALCLCSAACAPAKLVVQPDLSAGDPREWEAFPADPGARIAARAGELSGLASLKLVTSRLPDDCTGLARAAYEAAGAELMDEGERGDNGVTAMYRKAERLGALHTGTPRPGDLVFFRETYDRNRNGRFDDGLTHVAVVEAVEPSGTVVFVHRGGAGITRGRMTLAAATQRTGASGEVLNDFLRPKSRRSRAYLAGELFVSFAAAQLLVHQPVALSRH